MPGWVRQLVAIPHKQASLMPLHDPHERKTACSSHLCLLLHDGEDALNADADSHAGHLPSLGIKHPHQPIIAPPAGHAAHTDGLLRVVVLWLD